MAGFRRLRASKTWALVTVCEAIFVDMLLANLVAPVLPFALSDLLGLDEDEVQRWNAILLALYGGALTFGSGPWAPSSHNRSRSERSMSWKPILKRLENKSSSPCPHCCWR